MAKYIDAERLRAEIEHRIEILADVSVKCAKNDDMEMHNYYHGKAVSLEELLPFIGSLNRRSIPDFPITDKDIKEFLATHPKVEVPEKYKNPDWLLKKQEQPDNEDVDKVAQELYEHLYELKRRNNVPTNLYDKQEIIDLWKAGIVYGRSHPKQEQPEVDLEKEIDKVIADYSFTKTIDSGGFKTTFLDYAKIARHFYELGAEHLKK